MTLRLKKFWLRQTGKKRLLKTLADERMNLDAPAATAADTDEKEGALPHAQAAVKESAQDEFPPI